MSMERAIEVGWEEVQRQGQDILERVGAVAQGLGCMLQSHMRFSGIPMFPPAHITEPALDRQGYDEVWPSYFASSWPLLFKPSHRTKACINRVQFNGRRRIHVPHEGVVAEEKLHGSDRTGGVQELGYRLGEAGAAVGACVGGFMHSAMTHISWPFQAENVTEAFLDFLNPRASESPEHPGNHVDVRSSNDPQSQGGPLLSRDLNQLGPLSAVEEDLEEVSDSEEDYEDASDTNITSHEQFHAVLTRPHHQLHRQRSSASIMAMFDSRTQEVQSSFVARGDLWRTEASQGGNSSGTGPSPVLLVQLGPILLVRGSTLLLPVHLSKQHILWYGFDRRNGVHSLCPAIWSKQHRWLLMSMICLNPFTCSFLDFQFPNGQCTYIAGESVSSGGFLHAFGGLLQAQGRYPGDMKVSFSKKVGWGTRITPALHLPEKSLSFDIVQQLGWQRSGAMVRPIITLSVAPTLWGRNAGWRAEIIHFPKEELSLAGGFALTIQPTAFASVSIGRSKRNGSHSGNSGVEVQVEMPLDNIRRASFTIKLNSGIDF